jgi:hypothetical protein
MGIGIALKARSGWPHRWLAEERKYPPKLSAKPELAAKSRWQIEVLSVTPFEKMPILQALQAANSQNDRHAPPNN